VEEFGISSGNESTSRSLVSLGGEEKAYFRPTEPVNGASRAHQIEGEERRILSLAGLPLRGQDTVIEEDGRRRLILRESEAGLADLLPPRRSNVSASDPHVSTILLISQRSQLSAAKISSERQEERMEESESGQTEGERRREDEWNLAPTRIRPKVTHRQSLKLLPVIAEGEAERVLHQPATTTTTWAAAEKGKDGNGAIKSAGGGGGRNIKLFWPIGGASARSFPATATFRLKFPVVGSALRPL